MIAKHLTKKDVEGFLSAFIYNTYGSTNADSIAPLVFTEENYVSKKLNNRTRANPPPPDVNGDLDLYDVNNEDIHNSRVKEVLKNLEEKVFSGPVKMFQVFRQFDKDGDGFVSYADFED
jgi:Ca2+-binding EF-hand superfamily protein